MARTLCKILGVVLMIVGLVGFATPNLLGMHLTPIHNVVHLLTAAIALTSASRDPRAAREPSARSSARFTFFWESWASPRQASSRRSSATGARFPQGT